jgi:hypothetical protein
MSVFLCETHTFLAHRFTLLYIARFDRMKHFVPHYTSLYLVHFQLFVWIGGGRLWLTFELFRWRFPRRKFFNARITWVAYGRSRFCKRHIRARSLAPMTKFQPRGLKVNRSVPAHLCVGSLLKLDDRVVAEHALFVFHLFSLFIIE